MPSALPPPPTELDAHLTDLDHDPGEAWIAAVKAAPMPLAFLVLAPSMRTPHFIVKISVLCILFGALAFLTTRAKPYSLDPRPTGKRGAWLMYQPIRYAPRGRRYVVATVGLTIVTLAWWLAF